MQEFSIISRCEFRVFRGGMQNTSVVPLYSQRNSVKLNPQDTLPQKQNRPTGILNVLLKHSGNMW